MNKDQSILLNKYNRLRASHSDLAQQLEDKSEQLRELERTSKITFSNLRVLCKEILAKDPNEMVLGRSYSWDSLEINSLIEKSIQVFRSYNTDRTNLMRRLYSQNEDLALQVSSLSAQIETLENFSRNRPAPEKEEDTGEIQAPVPVKAALQEPVAAISKAPFVMKQAMEAGKIEAIIEEDTDVGSKDLLDAREALSLADALSVKMKDIPVHPAKKKAIQQQTHEQKRREAYMVDLGETKKQLTEVEWVLLSAIGTYGLSQFPLIEAKAQEIWPQHASPDRDKLSNSRIRMGLQKLINLQAVQQELVATPFVSKLTIYSLTPMGTHIYKRKHNREPVLSERDQVVAEHDNIEHGYGIKAVHDMLESSGFFKSVCSTMKENRIPLEGGLQYIPDIITIGERYKSYFEYERGTHVQKNFNAKLNKACKVTNFIHIVTPNRQALLKVVRQVEEWIQSRGGHNTLVGKKVRVATAQYIKGKNPNRDESWSHVFDMKSDKPIDRTLEDRAAIVFPETDEAVPAPTDHPSRTPRQHAGSERDRRPQQNRRNNRPHQSGPPGKAQGAGPDTTGA